MNKTDKANQTHTELVNEWQGKLPAVREWYEARYHELVDQGLIDPRYLGMVGFYRKYRLHSAAVNFELKAQFGETKRLIKLPFLNLFKR